VEAVALGTSSCALRANFFVDFVCKCSAVYIIVQTCWFLHDI
jgi:hypothetical protein